MDYSTEYQQNYRQYGAHQPQQSQASAAAETYDPSQTQTYYAYDHHHHHYQQQPQHPYQYYPSQPYLPAAASSYPQQFHQEPTSVHPPGVPIPPDPAHFHDQCSAYYSHGTIQHQPNLTLLSGTQASMHPQIGQSAYRGGGRKGGRSFRGGKRSVGSGRSHGAASNSAFPVAAGQTPSTIPGQVPGARSRPPPPMAWCELCRVDCNTMEILEQHKTGKRHKRNLQTHVDLQNLNKHSTGQQNFQMPNSGNHPEFIQPQKVEESREEQLPQETLPFQTLIGDASNETELQKSTVDLAQEPQRKSRDQSDSRGRGFKRKMRGGRGGKYMRTIEGPRRPVEPPKPKKMIPIICELCNVKCESQVVLDSHLVGKKHLANLKRFNGHRAIYGESAVQSLYPPSCNTPSSSVFPQVQLGVNDPRAVMAQLLTFVISQAQSQASGLLAEQLHGLAAQIPGLAGMVAPTPVPAPGSNHETQYHLGFQPQGSATTTEKGSKCCHMVEAEGLQQSIVTDSAAPDRVVIKSKAESGMSVSEEKNTIYPQDSLAVASSEKLDSPASASKCEVATADEAVQGDNLDDSENVQVSVLESSGNKDDKEEARQVQNNE